MKKTGEVFGKAKEAGEAAMEKTGEVLGNVKDRVKDKAHRVEEASEKAKEKVFEKSPEIGEEIKEAGESVVEKTKGAMGNVKERVIEKEHEFEQGVKEAGIGCNGRFEEGAYNIVGSGKYQNKGGLFQEGGRNFTNLIRSGGKQAYTAIRQTVSLANLVMVVVQLMVFGIAFGASVWITFASGFVLSSVLPEGLFGVVQSKIYPMYFKISLVSILCKLIAHVGRCLKSGECGSAVKYQVWNLLGAIVMVLFNLYWLEPCAAKVMFERMKLEKEEG